jgi:hypothetical protein
MGRLRQDVFARPETYGLTPTDLPKQIPPKCDFPHTSKSPIMVNRAVGPMPANPACGALLVEVTRAMVEARMQPVAVEFDFVQPLIAFRRGVDELRELRRDPSGESRRA